MTRYRFDQIAINVKDARMPEPKDKETYIGLEHLDSDSLYVTRWGNNADLIGKKLCAHKGDVLFARRNAYLKRVAICPFDCLFSAHGMILHPIEKVIDKDYFPFFIKSDSFMNAAIKISVGSLSPTVNWKDLQKLEFDLPPIEEQKRLAEILWAAEDLKQKYTKALIEVESIIKSEFVRLFGDVNKNPKYQCVPLFEIANLHNHLRKPLNESQRNTMKNSTVLYPYYGATGCVDYISEYNINMEILCVAEDCGEYGTDQKCSYIVSEKCWVNNHVHILTPKENVANNIYLNYYFTYKNLIEYISGGTRTKLTKNDLSKIQVTLPPISLQNEFEIIVDKIMKLKTSILSAQKEIGNIMTKILN